MCQGIMCIFHQNRTFSNILVVCGVRVQTMVAQGAIRKTTSSLGG
jgi:hypothetical protein